MLEAATAALLQLGFDVHAKDTLGRTALQLAAKDGYEAIVNLLLKYDFSLDMKSDDFDDSRRRHSNVYPGSTALHFAARQGHISIVKTLLNHGATVDSRDAKNATPLHHAIINGKTEIVKVLLEAKADISSTVWSTSYQPLRTTDAANFLERKSQKSLLSTAIVSNSVDIVKLFIDAGADVNEHADDNCPPLFYTLATRRGVEMMGMLLGAGADPNIMWRYDRKSLLMWCTHDWHPGTIDRAKLLLDAGADINHSTGFSSPSRSALGGAQRSGMPTVVQYLVERGADLKLGFALHELWYVNEKASDKNYMSNEEYGNIMSKEQSASVLGNDSELSATEAVG
ncbi:hypothetical protein J4E86_004427 [Alternaria arbusti]|uniref:uncharacterized protein n=1 Tax=Alternaria arbusti TaxID=232088 RepID=UPI00221FB52A|nr:uncharacterized protein J4E86_004427 [Alternaria arbusti]KAI4958820.1 hypothetical protein J4E86_004427 [Alternaria arbusti]